MRRIAIIALILLAAVLGYGWYWYGQATQLRHVVERSLERFGARVSQQDPRVKISYDKVAVSGFPLPHAKIKGMKIEMNDLVRQYVLTVKAIPIEAEASDYSMLSAQLPQHFSLEAKRGDIREYYDIRLDESPKLLVALTNKKEKMSDKAVPKRFVTVFPNQLTLSFQLNDLQRTILFNTALMRLSVWQTIRYDVGSGLSFFYDILAEAASRAQ